MKKLDKFIFMILVSPYYILRMFTHGTIKLYIAMKLVEFFLKLVNKTDEAEHHAVIEVNFNDIGYAAFLGKRNDPYVNRMFQLAEQKRSLNEELENIKKELSQVFCLVRPEKPLLDSEVMQMYKDNLILKKATQEGFDLLRQEK